MYCHRASHDRSSSVIRSRVRAFSFARILWLNRRAPLPRHPRVRPPPHPRLDPLSARLRTFNKALFCVSSAAIPSADIATTPAQYPVPCHPSVPRSAHPSCACNSALAATSRPSYEPGHIFANRDAMTPVPRPRTPHTALSRRPRVVDVFRIAPVGIGGTRHHHPIRRRRSRLEGWTGSSHATDQDSPTDQDPPIRTHRVLSSPRVPRPARSVDRDRRGVGIESGSIDRCRVEPIDRCRVESIDVESRSSTPGRSVGHRAAIGMDGDRSRVGDDETANDPTSRPVGDNPSNHPDVTRRRARGRRS